MEFDGGSDGVDAFSTGMTQHQRIQQRRQRVEEALRAKKAKESGEGVQLVAVMEEEEESRGLGEQQVEASVKFLDELQSAGSSSISELRVLGDAKERERRMDEDMRQEEAARRLIEEEKDAAKRNAAIAMRWSSLYEIEVPDTLRKELEVVREACERVIQSKDIIVDGFKEDLTRKDKEYVQSLRQQADAVDDVIERMRKQTKELKRAYERELDEIERSFVKERKELIAKNREDLDKLYEKRREIEQKLMEKRLKLVEEQEDELDRMREKGGQKYSQLKADLQKDIQELEQEAEEMYARYLLNRERLGYNFKVLSERVHENKKAISQHKRKLARLQDALSVVIAKYQKSEREYKHENDDLTDAYLRIADQFKEMQKKFKRFEKMDADKFREIWEMNEEQAMELVDKLMHADRVLTEQELGMEWISPAEDLLAEPSEGGAAFGGPVFAVPSVVIEAGGGGGGGIDRQPAAAGMRTATPARPASDNVKAMLKNLCSEAGFLVEDRVKAMVADLDKDEREMVMVDSILKALGVETQAEIEAMLPYFTNTEHGEDPHRAPLLQEQDVIEGIKRFVADQQRQAARQSPTVTVSVEDRARKRRREEERQYWQRLKEALPDERYRLWKALERAMEKYSTVLKEREGLLMETSSLREQNDELRQLLEQYMTAKVNEELYVPPILTQQVYSPAGEGEHMQ